MNTEPDKRTEDATCPHHVGLPPCSTCARDALVDREVAAFSAQIDQAVVFSLHDLHADVDCLVDELLAGIDALRNDRATARIVLEFARGKSPGYLAPVFREVSHRLAEHMILHAPSYQLPAMQQTLTALALAYRSTLIAPAGRSYVGL